MDRTDHRDIRIGTLTKGGDGTVDALEILLPHGFESFSITFWQQLGDVDLARLADDVRGALDGHDAVVSSLAVFGNPLGDTEIDGLSRAAWEAAIDHAGNFGCDLVCGFTGRVRGASIPDSIPRYVEVFAPLADRAAARGVRLAFENCPMGGTWKLGDWNIAHHPVAWELLFAALPAAHLGLEWEPCHQLVQLIDPMPQLRHWANRIFHVHGKDASVYSDVLRESGIHGPVPWCHHRTPGFGDSDWTAIISRLRLNGFCGSIDIEGWHDPVYRKELELTGQVYALKHLQVCRGGAFLDGEV